MKDFNFEITKRIYIEALRSVKEAYGRPIETLVDLSYQEASVLVDEVSQLVNKHTELKKALIYMPYDAKTMEDLITMTPDWARDAVHQKFNSLLIDKVNIFLEQQESPKTMAAND